MQVPPKALFLFGVTERLPGAESWVVLAGAAFGDFKDAVGAGFWLRVSSGGEVEGRLWHRRREGGKGRGKRIITDVL